MTPTRQDFHQTKRQQACINCNRKKVRCPGEKPFCSNCTRLNQSCSYRRRDRPSVLRSPVEERLANVEEQLSRILSGKGDNGAAAPQSQTSNTIEFADNAVHGIRTASLQSPPSPSFHDVQRALKVYDERCHRQPLWCLDPQSVENSANLPVDLASSLLALTCRYCSDLGHRQFHLDQARTAIMFNIAKGSVDFSTLQALCLISYAMFLDGQTHLGQFHLGLASQLCRSAMLDRQSLYEVEDAFIHAKRRLFWSLQILEQTYGSQMGLLQYPSATWRVFPSLLQQNVRQDSKLPDTIHLSFPNDNESSEIWNFTIHLGWIWSMVRRYVTDASVNRIMEPWRQDSQYTQIMSDLMQIETRMPNCHRYETVRFYQRQPQELKDSETYWRPWLRLQFTYHATHVMLNHPFLYISISQHDSIFSSSNSFWRESKERVLSHATWIARMVDMVLEKEVQLNDPFFAHAATIAATVHLYYCCAPNPKLRSKSRIDLGKCLTFLEQFTSVSSLCRTLALQLKRLLQIASGLDSVDLANWSPSKLYLNSNIMWDILALTCDNEWSPLPTTALLRPSLQPPSGQTRKSHSTFEITVAASPEVTVEVSDSGQAAPGPPSATNPDSSNAAGASDSNGIIVVPSDRLQARPTWLWQGTHEPTNTNPSDTFEFTDSTMMSNWDAAWWEFSNL